MHTLYEFLFVEKLVRHEAKRNIRGYSIDRSYCLLFVRPPKSSQLHVFTLNRSIVIPVLKRNDKIKLIFDLFTRGHNRKVEIKILAVELLE